MHLNEEGLMGKDNLVLGIIGGSGIYDINGVENGEWVKVTTPYGDPSDEIFTGSNYKSAMPGGAQKYEEGANNGLIDLADIDLRMSEHIDMLPNHILEK